MSRPAEYENGAHESNIGLHPVSGGVQDPPSVYHPQEQPAPSYEEYNDPAAAHGWQNAYDETAQLPAVVPDADRPQRRAAPGHRARRRPSRWSSPRVAVAGAVGAVSVAAVIAGFSFSGTSSGGTGGKGAHTGPTATDLPAPTGQEESAASGDAQESSGGASASAEPSTDATTPGSGSPTPSSTDTAATSSQPSAPATTSGSAPAETTYAPGNSGNNPGHGKRPR
ncbi:hypothetical protein [Streptomyces sp. SLBN-31]|uniref:hypothetical protein n=1 Tax=Streptomyces sp. SLBN-31 TaxID=2768444 RepID=UPI0011548B44|nr:hypothetical protein [Streptomyces sp. SLBN-31]TQJ89650.1 hypothetical protein FBY22_0413 [Streptomyces sp. SLBN-31]